MNMIEGFRKIKLGEDKIAIIGLGYVGLPLAVAFDKYTKVIGFDTNKNKIEIYKEGKDPTKEIGDEGIHDSEIFFTYKQEDISDARFFIVAIPTPINSDKTPNLDALINSCEVVGRNMKKDSIVIYESTVYPGVIEEICLPILERESGLIGGQDFKIAYSPERVNPGDKVHRLENIVKIVSGMDEETLDIIEDLYSLIIDAGVFRASSIKVAEAAKVVENSQRDINIAFMNELSMIFDHMGIITKDVIDAMNTKWNAMGFVPGLVGGHCISVDPYYFIYKAESLGYHSQIILSGRQINDDMPFYIFNKIIKSISKIGKPIHETKIVFYGLTFKENCPDLRNSKIFGTIRHLKDFDAAPIYVEPFADSNEIKDILGENPMEISEISDVDIAVIVVAHEEFKKLPYEYWESIFGENEKKVIIDIKSILDRKEITERGILYWSL